MHVHLGLYGTFDVGEVPAPATGRAAADAAWSGDDPLRRPAGPDGLCDLITERRRREIRTRLGEDPLRRDADPERAWTRIAEPQPAGDAADGPGRRLRASGTSTAPSCCSGTASTRSGRATRCAGSTFDAMWAGPRRAACATACGTGRIDTVRPEHTPEAMGRAAAQGRPRRRGLRLPPHRASRAWSAGPRCAPEGWPGRNLFWCPRCQPRSGRGPARFTGAGSPPAPNSPDPRPPVSRPLLDRARALRVASGQPDPPPDGLHRHGPAAAAAGGVVSPMTAGRDVVCPDVVAPPTARC